LILIRSFRKIKHTSNGRIISTCNHRVIGKNGTLTGCAGGVWRKEKLLTLEGLLVRSGKIIRM